MCITFDRGVYKIELKLGYIFMSRNKQSRKYLIGRFYKSNEFDWPYCYVSGDVINLSGGQLYRDTVIRLNLMFIGCVGLVFGSKNVQFRIICSF